MSFCNTNHKPQNREVSEQHAQKETNSQNSQKPPPTTMIIPPVKQTPSDTHTATSGLFRAAALLPFRFGLSFPTESEKEDQIHNWEVSDETKQTLFWQCIQSFHLEMDEEIEKFKKAHGMKAYLENSNIVIEFDIQRLWSTENGVKTKASTFEKNQDQYQSFTISGVYGGTMNWDWANKSFARDFVLLPIDNENTDSLGYDYMMLVDLKENDVDFKDERDIFAVSYRHVQALKDMLEDDQQWTTLYEASVPNIRFSQHETKEMHWMEGWKHEKYMPLGSTDGTLTIKDFTMDHEGFKLKGRAEINSRGALPQYKPIEFRKNMMATLLWLDMKEKQLESAHPLFSFLLTPDDWCKEPQK